MNNISNAKYFVKISGVKSFEGKNIDEYSSVLSLCDAIAPSVKEVVYQDASTVRVKFTEPINATFSDVANATKFTLDGVNVVVPSSAFTLSGDSTYVDINVATAGLTREKNYTMTIDGLVDYASNALTKYQGAINVAKDTVAPTVVDVTPLSTGYLKLTFSEKVKTGYQINVDGAPMSIIPTDADTVNPDGKTFIVNLQKTFAEGNHIVTVYNYNDLSSNAGETFTKEIKFAATKPAISNTVGEIKTISSKEYAVFTFDREVSPSGTAVDGSFVDKDGVTIDAKEIALVGHSTVDGLAKNQIGIDITAFKAGNYTFKLAKGVIADTYSQAIDETNVTFTRSEEATETTVDSILPNGVTTDGTTTGSLNKIQVKFVGNVSAEALNVSHYTIDGVQAFDSAIFNGDKSRVLLTLKSGAISTNGDKTVKVTGIANVTDSTNKVTLKENVKPAVSKVELIGYNSIRLTMSETIKSGITIDGNDLTVKVNGVKVSNSIKVTGAGTDVLVITLDDKDKLTSSTTPVTITVTSDSDIADSNGNLLPSGDLQTPVVNFVDSNVAKTNAEAAVAAFEALPVTTVDQANAVLTDGGKAATAAIKTFADTGASADDIKAFTGRVDTKIAAAQKFIDDAAVAGATTQLAKITDASVTTLPAGTASTKAGVEAAMLTLATSKIDSTNYTVTIADGSTYNDATKAWSGKFVVTNKTTATDTITDTNARAITVVIPAVNAGAIEQLAKITDASVTTLPAGTANTKADVEAAMLTLATSEIDSTNYTVTIADGSTYNDATKAWSGKFVVTNKTTTTDTITDTNARTITVVIE